MAVSEMKKIQGLRGHISWGLQEVGIPFGGYIDQELATVF